MSLFPEPPPGYFCKLLGHDLKRWVALPIDILPRVGRFVQIGMCSRCQHPLLRPASTGDSNG